MRSKSFPFIASRVGESQSPLRQLLVILLHPFTRLKAADVKQSVVAVPILGICPLGTGHHGLLSLEIWLDGLVLKLSVLLSVVTLFETGGYHPAVAELTHSQGLEGIFAKCVDAYVYVVVFLVGFGVGSRLAV